MRIIYITDRHGVRHTIFLQHVTNVLEYLTDSDQGGGYIQIYYVHGHGAQRVAISILEWIKAVESLVDSGGDSVYILACLPLPA
jgi:hypothetical protein